MKIKISFATITEESAREGDYSETGWENEEGVGFDRIDEAVDFLKSEGAVEPSSSCPHVGIWYSDTGHSDMHTGDETIRSFHLEGFTPDQELQIFKKIYPSYNKMCTLEILNKMRK